MEKKEFISISKSIALKGILAIMVLICHLHARIDLFRSSRLGTLFSAFGYLAVAVFFFLSGYGLTEQANTNIKGYAKTFPRRKILPFYLICLFLIVFYFLRDAIIYKQVDIIDTIWSFFIGKTIVDMGWYLQVQLLMYLIFYFAIRFFDFKHIWWITLVGLLIYVAVSMVVNLSSTWYEGVICFSLGIIVAQNKDRILSLIDKKLRAWLIILGVFYVFMVAFYFGNTYDKYYIRIAIKMISCILFALLAVLLTFLVKIDNPITKGIGGISLEIYVIQGFALNLFSKTISVDSDILYIICVVILTSLLSIALHPLFKLIYRIGRKENKAIVVENKEK